MASYRTFRFADGSCRRQLGQWQNTSNGYDWVGLSDYEPCGREIEPVGSIRGSQSNIKQKAIPFAPDNGVRPSAVKLTDAPKASLQLVKQGNAATSDGGCGCASADGDCSCKKRQLKQAGVAILGVAFLLAIAYGVSKLIPE